MSDINEGRHPLSPRSNSKVVPPYIPPPRKESLEAENARLKAEVERLTELNATLSLRYDATKSMLDGCAKEIEEMEAEVERLTEALNKFTNTPNGVHGVEVKVSFWSKSGCRLPSSFSTFWMNAEKGQP